MNLTDLKQRVADLLELAHGADKSSGATIALAQGTLTVLAATHGHASVQVRSYQDSVGPLMKGGLDTSVQAIRAREICRGVLRSLQAELDLGLASSISARVTGELLSDLVLLSRTVLSEADESGVPVAAVLAAAAFEDTIRRLASANGISHFEKLADTITALKDAQVLVGPQVGIATSYLKFRNDALHARWAAIERASVASILGFVEQMLLRHFG